MLNFWRDDSTKAVILGCLSGVLVANTNLCVKISSNGMSTFQILFLMSTGNLIISIIVALCRKKGFGFESKDAIYLILRSLSMTAARMFYYVAIARLPVFDAETIKNTRSTFTLFLLVITCQEMIGLLEFGAGFITFAGVVFVCKPPMIFGGSTQPIDVIGILTGLSSAMCHAGGYLFTKKIPAIHYSVMNFYEFLFHMIGSVLLMCYFHEWSFPSVTNPYITVIIATFSLFSTTALQIIALSYGSAAIVAITINMNVPALFCLQAIIQHVIPTYLTIIGSLLVLAGVILITFRNDINKKIRNCSQKQLIDENSDHHELE